MSQLGSKLKKLEEKIPPVDFDFLVHHSTPEELLEYIMTGKLGGIDFNSRCDGWTDEEMLRYIEDDEVPDWYTEDHF